MNTLLTDFFAKIKDKTIVVYGVGGDGTLLYHMLEVNHYNISTFVVDNGYRTKENYRGIPIVEYDGLSSTYPKKDVCVLVAMNTNPNKKKRIDSLLADEFKDVFDCDRIFMDELLMFNCQQYIKKYNLNIEHDFIDLINTKKQTIRIINPFVLEYAYQIAFALEIPDLLVPELDNEFVCLNEGKYEIGEVVVEKEDVVFDCGANIGLFSAIAAAKGATVYAFEPAPVIIPILEKLQSHYPTISIEPIALTEKTGTVRFSVSTVNSTSHSIIPTNTDVDVKSPTHHLGNITEVVEVPAITIDEFVSSKNIKRVDYIKADIEGAERYMLRGAKQVLAKFAPKLSICTYHLPDDKEVLEKIVLDANPNYIIEHRWKKMYAYVPQHKR